MKQKPFGHYLLLVLRGTAMGGADLIPGVSGGTIAFITGIYEELIRSIKSINAKLFQVLVKEGFPAAWKHINGSFLLAVAGGILFSIFSLARAISWLLSNHPMLVWAFFFGLIVGSAIYIGRKIERWTICSGILLLAGSLLAYYITIATPATTPEHMWFVFLSGAIAFCALVLPGISGAFILVLLGKYEFMLHAVRDLKADVILVFATGGAMGVILFSNVIAWLFKNHPNATLALLSGFMIGSLNKLWPWKEVLEWHTGSQGDAVPLLEKSVSPWRYEELTSQDPQILPIIICMLAGITLVLLFMFFSKKKGMASQKKEVFNEKNKTNII